MNGQELERHPSSTSQRLARQIRGELAAQGVLSFARFMELALYAPGLGYYEQERTIIGKQGDFYTSVSVGSLFGQLLAFQFAQWWQQARGHAGQASGALQLIEAGAHDGQLAADILAWWRSRRLGLDPGLEYWIVEPSARRRAWQQTKLAEFAAQVQWVPSLAEVPWPPPGHAGGYRILFCNELLDAMPVHRWGWDAAARTWFEWGVSWNGRRFVWQRMPGGSGTGEGGAAVGLRDPHAPASLEEPQGIDGGSLSMTPPARVPPSGGLGEMDGEPGPPEGGTLARFRVSKREIPFGGNLSPSLSPDGGEGHLTGLAGVLPDGYTIETCPAAEEWWRQAAAALHHGVLLAVDYGLSESELFVPERTQGTLRACRQHRAGDDPLADPGEQDLTAHVNLTALRRIGEAAGLRTEAELSQGQFLTGIAGQAWADPAAFGEWTSHHTRQFQTLTHPGHLGRAFRVLRQSI